MEDAIIPVIDFDAYSLTVEKQHSVSCSDTLDKLADDIHAAFTDIGFIYLQNHGISQDQIEVVTAMLNTFVSMPEKIKSKYRVSTPGHGWIPVNGEALNSQRPPDIKESYNTLLQYENTVPCPDSDVPGFTDVMNNFFKLCNDLVQRILHVLGIGLKLQDPYYFCKLHNTYTRANRSSLRTLYYPPVDIDKVLPDQLRCGEHSDWGSITLLFQDEAGGLQVKSRKGEFVSAKPIPGTVVVNVGDIMQRWTDNKLTSTKHRVLLPRDSNKSRNSVAFFALPDNDCLVKCMDGCNKYQPVVFNDYLNMKIKEAYN